MHEKVEFGGHAFFDFEVRGLDEEATDADVLDTGDIIDAIAPPADPDVLWGEKACEGAAGVGRFLAQEGLPRSSGTLLRGRGVGDSPN